MHAAHVNHWKRLLLQKQKIDDMWEAESVCVVGEEVEVP